MSKGLSTLGRAALKRHQRRSRLGPKLDAVVGATLGLGMPVAIIVYDNRQSSPQAWVHLREAKGFIAYFASIGLLCSQRGWFKGVLLAVVGTAALSAPIGGFDPEPVTGEDWRDTALFGAGIGFVAWLAIRSAIGAIQFVLPARSNRK
jgi:hypothetical protein